MDTNTIMLMGNFIAIVAMFITMVVLIQSQNKKFDAIQKELHEFKIMTNERFSRMEMRMERMEVKLDIVDKDYSCTNKRFDKSEEITNKRFEKIEIDNKEIIGKVLDKLQPITT